MKAARITPSMLKTAWKMARTVFDQHRCSAKDRDALLNLTLAVALHDLLEDRLEWRKRPTKAFRLMFDGQNTKVTSQPGPGMLRARMLDHQVDEASAQAETLFDRYQLDEDERDTLFTALPCLGLKALDSWVRWTGKPPFPEVGK